MHINSAAMPRFQGVFCQKPENIISIPFEHDGKQFWASGEDLFTVCDANIAVFDSGLLTIDDNGKPKFIEITGDHQDALIERRATFKRLAALA